MKFAHDTEVALRGAVDLVNTALVNTALVDTALVDTAHEVTERLPDPAALDAFLDEQGFTGDRAGTDDELAGVHALRARIEAIWDADEAGVVEVVNGVLAEARALPRLTRHDHWDWHLHLTDPQAPLVDRIGTEVAMAIADLIRAKDLDRLKRCAADDCDAVLVDLSRNRSRRYCDTGNCANRAHVAAYRARKAGAI